MQHIAESNDSKLIENFVEEADGDYIVYIIREDNIIIFNDYMGRLPFYYHVDDNRNFFASRKLNFILSNIDSISILKSSVVEYLMFEFQHGTKTLFKDIYKLDAHQILAFQNGAIEVKTTVSSSFDCSNKQKDLAKKLSSIYLKATEERVNYFKNQPLLCTLSGGFDSRAVLAGLSHYTDNVDYVTYEYIQDESAISKRLVGAAAPTSRFKKLHFKNVPDLESDDLLFRTSGLINVYTNSVCYNDLRSLYDGYPKQVLFGGFGGEFFRHPYMPSAFRKSYCKCLFEAPFENVFKDQVDYQRKVFNDIVNLYPEKTNRGFFKHLYYDYYKNYVVGAGEERYRLYYWTVQTLMSKDAVELFMKQDSILKSDYLLFGKVISIIKPCLVNIPIFGDNQVLSNTRYWFLKSLKNKAKPILILGFGKLRNFMKRNTRYECEVGYDNISPLFKQPIIYQYFNSELLANYTKLDVASKRRLYTILRYVIVLNNRLGRVRIE